MITIQDSDEIKAVLQKNCVKNSDGCWIWTRSYRGSGYAQVTISGRRQVQGNRAAYLAYVGEIPPGMWVLHRCDVRLCCNPEHLFLGTAADNTKDCVNKGRLRPRNGGLASRKINPSEFPSIFAAYAGGMKQKDIALRYGVTQVCISQILRRKRRVDYPTC